MTMLLAAFISVAFAGVYALVLAMLGARGGDLLAALVGQPLQTAGGSVTDGAMALAASRRLSRA